MKAMTSTMSGRPLTLTNSYDVSLEGLSIRSLSSFISFFFLLFFNSNSPTCFERSKLGTDLWATEDKGMIRAPDFGRILSKDRYNPYLSPDPNPNPNL